LIPPALLDRLRALYPALEALPRAQCLAALRDEAMTAELPAGSLRFEAGAPCRGFPRVLRGEVRVARGSAQGRSVELYRVTPGELCVASTSCLFGHSALLAHGATAADTERVVLSPAAFDRWVAHEPFAASPDLS
jgi:CRP/FNR family transcriptional regulator